MAYTPERPYGWVTTPSAMRVREHQDTKICTACRKELPNTSEFFYRKSPLGPFISRCKECKKKLRRSYPNSKVRGDRRLVVSRNKKRRRWERRAKAGFPPAPSNFWTAPRAAAELGITPGKLYDLTKEGKIPHVKHGMRGLRFDPQEIRRIARDG